MLISDRHGQPSSSKEASPPPQFADKGSGGNQLERSRKLNSEGLEVSCIPVQHFRKPSLHLVNFDSAYIANSLPQFHQQSQLSRAICRV